MLCLAILQILIIFAYDKIRPTSESREVFSEVNLIGRIQGIQKYGDENEEVYHLTVKGGKKPFQKMLLKISGRNLKKSLFHIKGKDEVSLGDRIKYKGKIKKMEKAKNPGSFDRQQYYQNEGYFGIVEVNRIQILNQTVFQKLKYMIPNQLFTIRNKIKEGYKKILGETVAGTLSAMVLGDRTELDTEIKELYADNAISHLLAISGLHISLVGMLLYQFFKKINLSFQMSLILPIFFLFLYGGFTGFSISTTRAVLMMTLFFLSYLLGRSYDLPTALSFSSIFILFTNHRLLYQASFQLSFLAVIGIFYAVRQAEIIFMSEEKGVEGIEWGKRFVKASILSTITLNLVLLPVLLWHYFEISLNGILLNVVVIPLMSIIVIMGLLGGITTFLSLLISTFLLGSANYLLKFYTFICHIADQNPWNKFIMGRPSLLQIFIYYVILCTLLGVLEKERRVEQLLMLKGKWKKAERKRRNRLKKYALVVIFSFAIWILNIREKEVEIYKLDVGRGQCEVISSGEEGCYVLNCGSTSIKNIGKTILIPFIKYHGWGRIRGFFITDMKEEYSSGILEVLEKKEIKIDKIILPPSCSREDREKRKEIIEKTKERKIKLYSFKEKERWREEGIEFLHLSGQKILVLYPNKE